MIPRSQHTTIYLARYLGDSEFYSGVRHGAIVWLTESVYVHTWADEREGWATRYQRKASVSLSVQGFYQDTAHLTLYDANDVEVIA